MTSHGELVEQAQKAIKAVFEDMSVSQETGAASLRALILEAEKMLASLDVEQ